MKESFRLWIPEELSSWSPEEEEERDQVFLQLIQDSLLRAVHRIEENG